jgi:hypothetical protein
VVEGVPLPGHASKPRLRGGAASTTVKLAPPSKVASRSENQRNARAQNFGATRTLVIHLAG